MRSNSGHFLPLSSARNALCYPAELTKGCESLSIPPHIRIRMLTATRSVEMTLCVDLRAMECVVVIWDFWYKEECERMLKGGHLNTKYRSNLSSPIPTSTQSTHHSINKTNTSIQLTYLQQQPHLEQPINI